MRRGRREPVDRVAPLLERAAFSATTSIDRRDFGLAWNQVLETGGVMVGERVNLEIEIEAVRQAAAKVA